tara:strand:- start:339 stop:728 length:390 start_codon:yes stop_codon:yes gene_type:complete
MARSIEFNPSNVFVARKSNGLTLASKQYQLGDTIDKAGLSRRKLLQLWSQGKICYQWMLEDKNLTSNPASKESEGVKVNTSVNIEEPKTAENVVESTEDVIEEESPADTEPKKSKKGKKGKGKKGGKKK